MVMRQLFIIRAFHKTLISLSSTRHFCASSSTSTSAFALKNVTKSNFESALSDLRRHVKDADFVAVDLEMTGVTSAPWRESFEFDRFDIQYLKVKDSAEKFAVVQFGVCPFRWDPHKQSFIAHPHNFYIFPRQEIQGDATSYEFLCQTTSIDFLAKYQFDFNTCICEGVSYLSRSQEEEALGRLNARYNEHSSDSSSGWRDVVDMKLVRIADILFSERLKNKITAWHDGLLRETNGGSQTEKSSNDLKQQLKTIFFKMRPALDLTGFTSHQLRLIQLVIKNNFKDLVYVSMTGETSSPQQLIVYTHSTSDRDLLLKEVKDCHYKETEMKIKAAVGFRYIIDLLSSEKKLIVGHNSFLDIAHIYRKFIGPLPSTAKEYVSSVQNYFPYIIDTKVLLNASNVFQPILNKSSTSLSKAFTLLCPQIASGVKTSGLADKNPVKVEVQVGDKRSLNWNSGSKHEAGYDAFMTGCVFAQACSHLGVDFARHPPSVDLHQNEKLQEYINLLYISWINGDIIDLRTGQCKPDSSAGSKGFKSRYSKILFSNIVLLWGFPSKLKASEIRECFCLVFGSTSVTSVYHLDETAVFIQFSKEELVSDFLSLKDTLERSNDPISVLHPLSKILEGGQTRAANYEAYRQICSSPISEVFFADQAEAVGIKSNTKSLESVTGVETREDETGANENRLLPDTPIETEIEQINSGPDLYGHCPTDEVDSLCTAEAQLSSR
ncbi:hypothetical protein ACH5RR_027760 [Cinchona calisaya]|uniref:Uncharacterized protein n=1 Tax=Cinchona calisaya TaxID=153742 RepID=A0ABD2YQR4_9GENT